MRDQHYFSTFISGFSEIIETTLSNRFQNLTIENLLDGLVIYQANVLPQKIKKLSFFNNSYLLLGNYKFYSTSKIERIIEQSFQKADLKRALKYISSQNIRTFKIVASKENQTVSVNRKILLQIEKKISKKLNLKLNVLRPDIEFWFLIRREGNCFCGIRITIVGR